MALHLTVDQATLAVIGGSIPSLSIDVADFSLWIAPRSERHRLKFMLLREHGVTGNIAVSKTAAEGSIPSAPAFAEGSHNWQCTGPENRRASACESSSLSPSFSVL